jgi:hypothetical protein
MTRTSSQSSKKLKRKHLSTQPIRHLKGLSPESKSFQFKLVHTLLPRKEKIHHPNPTSSPQCRCESSDQETYSHLFFSCVKNKEADEALLRSAQSHDQILTNEKILKLEISADETFLLPTVSSSVLD